MRVFAGKYREVYKLGLIRCNVGYTEGEAESFKRNGARRKGGYCEIRIANCEFKD